MLYGTYPPGFSFRDSRIEIKIERKLNKVVYFRSVKDKSVEKILDISSNSKFLIHPVEPVNIPKHITDYLEVDFRKPVIVSPKGQTVVFLKFPIEIGVFVSEKNKVDMIDVFTLLKPKYTLYGTPKSGVVCRWYESNVYLEIPKADPLEEGVLKLRIKNNNDDWAEVKKAVFDSYPMRLFYNDKIVAMQAEMKIFSKYVAETSFINQPILDGMTQAVELYATRVLSLEKRSFMMEWGY